MIQEKLGKKVSLSHKKRVRLYLLLFLIFDIDLPKRSDLSLRSFVDALGEYASYGCHHAAHTNFTESTHDTM